MSTNDVDAGFELDMFPIPMRGNEQADLVAAASTPTRFRSP